MNKLCLSIIAFVGSFVCTSVLLQAQTTGTTYVDTLGTTSIGTYPSVAAAEAAANAHGAGSYTITPYTTTQGAPTTFVVASCTPSASGTIVIAPASAVLTDAKCNKWGIVNGQVTLNGAADPTTHAVIEMAYVTGEIWQESTNLGGKALWWGTTAVPAVWLPAPGTATSPVPVTSGSGGGNGGTTGAVKRPAYNTGNGLFVLAGKLYDGNGNEFRIRGVDRCHYDSPSQPGISHAKANAVRMFMYVESSGASTYVGVAQSQHIANKEIPILTMAYFPDGTQASCNMSTGELASGAAWWAANAGAFAGMSKYAMINIANEWGPSSSTTWRDAYVSAITMIRKAGFLGPLVIDSGGCGQDMGDLLNYSAAVFNSDPQKNIVFSTHIYGGTPSASVLATNLGKLAALSASAGMAFVVGEFGPGRNIGPSPTLLTPQDVVNTAEADGIGWLAWAWDDNDLGGGNSDNNWFSMTLHGPGYYSTSADLTEYGQVMVPLLQQKAVPATTF